MQRTSSALVQLHDAPPSAPWPLVVAAAAAADAAVAAASERPGQWRWPEATARVELLVRVTTSSTC